MVAVDTHTVGVFIVSPSTLIVHAQLQLIIEQKMIKYNCIMIQMMEQTLPTFFTQEALSFELAYICIQESDSRK